MQQCMFPLDPGILKHENKFNMNHMQTDLLQFNLDFQSGFLICPNVQLISAFQNFCTIVLTFEI